MKIKTAELTGDALDYVLAKMRDHQWRCAWILKQDGFHAWKNYELAWGNWHGELSNDPATCLGLMKEYRANIDQAEHAPKVQVTIWYEIADSYSSDFDAVSAIGDTVEQAVARCVVAMRLGDEVEVPSELCEQRKDGV